MQVANPQYKFYKMLAGTWKNSDSSCTVVPNEFARLVISFGNAGLDTSYSVEETGPAYGAAGSVCSLGMMGQTYKRHEGEELMIRMNNTALSDGTRTLYTVSCLWYGEEKLNIELTDSSGGQTKAMVLMREKAQTSDATGYVCECGYKGPFGKFCPECGKLVPVEEEYTCQCGYKSKGTKFCPNCGQRVGQYIPDAVTTPEPAAPAAVPEEPLK